LREAVNGAQNLIVVDRALSFGGPAAPAFSEIKGRRSTLKKKSTEDHRFCRWFRRQRLTVAEF